MSAVLVTGAAGDLGGAIAEELAPTHELVLADQAGTEETLASRAEACRALGAEVTTATFDVTDDRAVGAALAEVGPLSGVVNNAGYQGVFAPVDRYPLDDARRVLEVNVLGVMTVLAVAARGMVDAGRGGAVVNIASMAGVSGAPNMSAYSASKAALIGLTRAAAKDLARATVRVNAVSPGFIGPGKMWETHVVEQSAAGSQHYADDAETAARQMVELVPLRRYGSAREVARVVAFLLSDAASYITGVNIEVSGGSA
jgi:NAD(P)-dependent dehydrogenase (short-subunit alcohol dehydrogenase family)